MDYEPYQNQPIQNPFQVKGFELAAIICGLVSLSTICTGFSMPIGALGILFAFLAHRSGKRLSPICRHSTLFSAFGVILPALIIISTLITLPEQIKDPNSQLNQISEQIYGMDFGELTDELRQAYDF